MEFRLKNRKVQIAAFFVLFIFAIKYSDLFLELPEAKRPVREAAMMTMALNPDKTEEVRLKIPWGYLAPNVSYMSAKDQNAFFANAHSMMRLMGLSVDSFNADAIRAKAKKADRSSKYYTVAYSLDALYPTFEAKNENNIDLFIGKRGVIRPVINISVSSIAKGNKWNNWKGGILISYDVYMNSLKRKLSKGKTYKHYGFSVEELPSEFGLTRKGLSDAAVSQLRADGFIGGAIPRDFWENRNASGELESFMQCMRPDKGRTCKHTMHVESINSKVSLLYHVSFLKYWQDIESKTRALFDQFIQLAKEHENG